MFGNSLLGCLEQGNSGLVESKSTGPGTTLFLGRWMGGGEGTGGGAGGG